MAYSKLATPAATRDVLTRYGHDPKYKLGQNFLVVDNVVGKIITLAALDREQPGKQPGTVLDSDQPDQPGTVLAKSSGTVLEIGPGIGTLTCALLERANVIAVERDSDLVEVLGETTKDRSDRFALIQGDALKIERADIESACVSLDAPLPTAVVANLPYQVAATVVLDWFERFEFLQSMTVMVQSEVADRMSASPATKSYGAYTAKLAMHARPAGRFQVPPRCFLPAPHVESSVIRLERIEQDAPADVVEAACACADAAFAQRRKTIRNSMKSAFETEIVDALLEACDIPPTTRGEKLSPQVYLQMGAALKALQES